MYSGLALARVSIPAERNRYLKHWNRSFSLDPDAYRLIWEDIRENSLTPDCAVMQGRLTVVRTLPDGRNFAMGVRFTSTCVRTSEGFKVSSIHASVPADFQEEGEFCPLSFAESVSEEYARRMGRSALELLGKTIPGGMLGTYFEPGFPLYYVNDRMLDCLGYTYEEFSQDSQGMVGNVHPSPGPGKGCTGWSGTPLAKSGIMGCATASGKRTAGISMCMRPGILPRQRMERGTV